MAPLDSQDADKIAEALERRARDSQAPHKTGEQHTVIDEKTTRFSWGVVAAVVTIVVFGTTTSLIARAADKEATKAGDKIESLEPRVVRLEEQRKADAELIRDTAAALKKNSEVLQQVQVELAKKK